MASCLVLRCEEVGHPSPASLWQGLREFSFHPRLQGGAEGGQERQAPSPEERAGIAESHRHWKFRRARVTHPTLATLYTHNWRVNHRPHLEKEFLPQHYYWNDLLYFLWKVGHAQNHCSSQWPLPLRVRLPSVDFHPQDKMADSTPTSDCWLCARSCAEHLSTHKSYGNELTLSW